MRLVSRLQRTQKGQSEYKKEMMAVVVVMVMVMAEMEVVVNMGGYGGGDGSTWLRSW